MCFVPVKQTLDSGDVDLLRPLPKTKYGNRFILVMADRCTKLTQVVPPKRTTSLGVAKSFSSYCVFKYGAPKEVLSDNVPPIESKLYQNTYRVVGIANTFT